MREQLNETIKEVEDQNKKHREVQTLLAEARDDIIKLEEANSLLKSQVCSQPSNDLLLTILVRQYLSGWMLQSQILMICFR